MELSSARTRLNELDIELLGGVPIVLQCHHFNLFWDQTIDDALGLDLGGIVRTRAAREAFHDLLLDLTARTGLSSPDAKKALAEGVFRKMGQGRLHLMAGADGGEVHGDSLHVGTAWREKYGDKHRRRRPADGIAAGFAAAATEVAHNLPRETVAAREIRCVALNDPRCEMSLRRTEQSNVLPPIRGNAIAERHNGLRGQHESGIALLASEVRGTIGRLQSDDRGLIPAFGQLMALLPTTYYNRSGYDALRHIQRAAPQSSAVMEALLREAGHVGAFHTFGGILASDDWEKIGGPPTGKIDDTVHGICAIARALGLGRWCLEELVPHERLVIRAPVTYESAYYAVREGRADAGRCYFFQGAALASMQLAHRVSWTSRPRLTPELYAELFRDGLPWRVEETQCVSKGDPCCEAVVSTSVTARNRLTL